MRTFASDDSKCAAKIAGAIKQLLGCSVGGERRNAAAGHILSARSACALTREGEGSRSEATNRTTGAQPVRGGGQIARRS